jgi:cytochrome c oxidase cbb3-type subunit 2
MMKSRTIYLSMMLIAAVAGSALAQNAGVSSGYPTPKNGFSPSEQHGHGLYLRYCVYCHGVFGDGNGDTAQFLDPKPRDFTIATFKCRSTPTGTLPLDSDLVNTLVRGVETTNMPSWRPLSDENRHDLIAYIKTFSERWKTEKAGDAIKIPAETPVTIESIRRGHDLFEKVECWKCHGQQGHGDGPSASTLTDSKDQPIRPYNFAAAGNDARFKCGASNEDLYRIFMTGLDGTPMPSFADVIQPNDAWDLVHFLRTLQINRHSKENEVLKAAGGPSALKSAGDKQSVNHPAVNVGDDKSSGGSR